MARSSRLSERLERQDVIRGLFDEASLPGPSDDPLVWLDAVAALLADALGDRDVAAVDAIAVLLPGMLQGLPDHAAGVLQVARAARASLAVTGRPLEPRSLAARMLDQIWLRPQVSNTALVGLLDTDETQVSRAGRTLTQYGFASVEKTGRSNRWTITTLGMVELHRLTEPKPVAGVALKNPLDEALEALGPGTDQNAVRSSASELARIGVSQRRSVNTRGSIVRTADQRGTDAEKRLLELLKTTTGPARLSVLSALGEWGSKASAAALSRLPLSEVPEDEVVELIGAVGKIGGPDSAIALADLVEQHAAHEESGGVALVALNAISELVTGGRTDATEGSTSTASRVERWARPEDGHAEKVQELLARLNTLGEDQAVPTALSRRIRATAALIETSLAANAVTPPSTASPPRRSLFGRRPRATRVPTSSRSAPPPVSDLESRPAC